MKAEYGEKAFRHEIGEFCIRRRSSAHFISFFLTDYLYESCGELIRGKGGDMLIIPAGEVVYHGPTPEMTSGFINDWLYVQGDGFIEEARRLSLPIGQPFSVGGERHLARFIEKAERERAFGEEEHEKMIELFIGELLIKLSRSRKKADGSDSLSKVSALRGELVQDPKRSWTLGEMATRCGYSESRFSALYKKTYGISPMADLLKIRLDSAKLLLSYSSRSVSEIAFDVGFSSVFYFSNYFKKYVGVAPKDYRASCG